MEAFVIKANDRYLYTYYIYEDENFAFGELNEAKLFSNFAKANSMCGKVKYFYNIDCEVVKIKLEEVKNG